MFVMIVNQGKVTLVDWITEEMAADIMTKPVAGLKLKQFAGIMVKAQDCIVFYLLSFGLDYHTLSIM